MPRRTQELKDPRLPATIGGRFKRACKELGITQDWLAAQTGVPRTTIARFGKGSRGMNSDNLVTVLSAAAERGVSMEFVFTGRRNVAAAEALRVLSDPDVVAGLRTLGLSSAPKPTGSK
jgi:predicted transcriptional regulator